MRPNCLLVSSRVSRVVTLPDAPPKEKKESMHVWQAASPIAPQIDRTSVTDCESVTV